MRWQRARAGVPARIQRLPVPEACGADLDDLAIANGRRTLRIVGKGAQPALIPLAPRTARSIDAAVGERTDGSLMAGPDASPLDRHAAGRIVRRLAKRAGIAKPISPHSVRHVAITAPLGADCSLRDMQDYARDADPRQTDATTAPAARWIAPGPTSSPPTSPAPPAPPDTSQHAPRRRSWRPTPCAPKRRAEAVDMGLS